MKMQRKWRRAWQRNKWNPYKGWWLRHKRKKNIIAQGKGIHNKRSQFVRWISPAAAAAVLLTTVSSVSVTDAANNNIATDGKTGTAITDVNSKVTNITTTTTIGNGATGLNSFTQFNVTAGNTVNMVLPTGAANLINLVNGGSQSQIYGVLNSIKDNKIGGNLYFLNPQGIVVGRGGSINAGSLALYTPTQDFVDKFFDSNNQVNVSSAQKVIDGTLPINANGIIYIEGGSVNAVNSIKFNTVRINEGAEVNVGANFDTSGSTAGLFDSVVNTNGWGYVDQYQNTIVKTDQDGSIEIVAGGMKNAGRIYSGGVNKDFIINIDSGDFTNCGGATIQTNTLNNFTVNVGNNSFTNGGVITPIAKNFVLNVGSGGLFINGDISSWREGYQFGTIDCRNVDSFIHPVYATLAADGTYTPLTNVLVNYGTIQEGSIVPDGKTSTTVENSLSGDKVITDVKTGTVFGNLALNSFRQFNVSDNKIVNLYLPDGADNLINLVSGPDVSTINGTINSLKGGTIGGHVYFLNPNGVVAGSGSVLNVGALTVYTPSANYMNGLFTGDGTTGNPYTPVGNQLAALAAGNAPSEFSGQTLSLDGTINAVSNVSFGTGSGGTSVGQDGIINTGAKFDTSGSTDSTFDKVVNLNAYGVGTIATTGNDSSLTVTGNLNNAGIINSGGAANFTVSTAGNLTNNGYIDAYRGTFGISTVGDLTNTGVIDGRGTDTFALNAGGILDNSAGHIYGLKYSDTNNGNNIATDGQTETTLSYSQDGDHQWIDDISTKSIINNNAYNSFSSFTVGNGNIINLLVPDNADNLINVVNGSQSVINGLVKSLKGGVIGGNVYFVNPRGLIVGKNGSLETGSLSVYNYNQNFVSGFFSAEKNKFSAALKTDDDLFYNSGNYTVAADSNFDLEGTVYTHRVGNTAGTQYGLEVLTDQAVLESGSAVYSNGGGVHIKANNQNLGINGTVDTSGGQLIIVDSGKNITVGLTGNISTGSLSIAADTFTDNGTITAAEIPPGESTATGSLNVFANTIIIDKPVTTGTGGFIASGGGTISLNSDITTNGGNLTVSGKNISFAGNFLTYGGRLTATAGDSITVNNNAILSTRKVADNTVASDHEKDETLSTGKSGDLNLLVVHDTYENEAKIDIDSGAKLLSFANNGYASNNDGNSSTDDGTVSVIAASKTKLVTYALTGTKADVNIHAAHIKGNNVNVQAVAQNDVSQNFDSSSGDEPDTATLGALSKEGTLDSIFTTIENVRPLVGFSKVKADAAVNIDTASKLEAGHDVTLDAESSSTSSAFVLSLVGGVGVILSDSDATVNILGGAAVSAGDNVNVTAHTVNKVSETTRPCPVVGNLTNKKIPVNVMVTYNELNSNSTVNLDDTSSITTTAATGKNININATSDKSISSTASASTGNGLLGFGVAINHSNVNAIANIDGTVAAGADLNVNAAIATALNDTTAQTVVGDGDPGSGLDTVIDWIANGVVPTVKGWIKKSSTPDDKPFVPPSTGIAGAMALTLSNNTALAHIGGDAAEQTHNQAAASAGGNMSINAAVTDVMKTSAIAQQKQRDDTVVLGESTAANKKDYGASAAIIYGQYKNTARAYIGDNATADAAKTLTVHSNVTIPFDNHWTDWKTNWTTNLSNAFMSDNLGLSQAMFTSWAQTSSDAGKGTASGSIDVMNYNTDSEAYIGKNSKINQNTVGTADDVNVQAENNITTLNLAGLLKSPMDDYIKAAREQAKPDVDLWGDASQGSGAGGSALVLIEKNTTKAYIDSGAKVNANNAAVKADTDVKNTSIGAAGGKTADIGFNGTVIADIIKNTTCAEANQAGIAAANNIYINAADSLYNINAAGGLTEGGSVGIGASIAFNLIERDTEALATGTLFAGNSLSVTGQNTGTSVGISLAGSATVDQPQTPEPAKDSDESDPVEYIRYLFGDETSDPTDPAEDIHFLFEENNDDPLNKVSGKVSNLSTADSSGTKAKSGLSVAANVALNIMKDQAVAWVGNSAADKTTVTVGSSNIKATNDTGIYALSGAVALAANTNAASKGIAGALMFNGIFDTTQADMANTDFTITGDSLSLSANNDSDIYSLSASGGIAPSGTGAAGQVSVNMLKNNTEAYIDQSQVKLNGPMVFGTSVSAADNETIVAVGGAVGYGGKAGIGASFGVNIMDNDVTDYINDSQITGNGDVTLIGTEDSQLVALTAAIGASQGQMAGAFSATGNYSANDVETYVSRGSDDTKKAVDITGSLSLGANDSSTVSSTAGSAAVAANTDGNGFGASAAVSIANDDVYAYIADKAAVAAERSKQTASAAKTAVAAKNVALTAAEGAQTVTLAAGGAGGGSAGMAGSLASNVLTQNTMAFVGKNAAVTASDASVEISANNTAAATGLAGALAIGKSAGVGVGAEVDVISGNTYAYIDSDAAVTAADNVLVKADSRENVISFAGSAAGGGKVGVAGAANVHVMNTDTEAFVGRSGDTLETAAALTAVGSGVISAEDDSTLTLVAGDAAYGGNAGIGAAVGVNVVTKKTLATVGDNANLLVTGDRSEVTVDLGDFTISYQDYGDGDVKAPTFTTNQHGDIDNTAAAKKRIATPKTGTIRGLAVTAVAQNTIQSVVAGGAAAKTVAADGSALVNVVSNTTDAHLGKNVHVSQYTEDQTINAYKSTVLVAAGSDYNELGLGGALAISGTAGVGAGAGVSVITNRTTAYIDDGSIIKTCITDDTSYVNQETDRDVWVKAAAGENIITAAAAVGGSANVGAAGSGVINVLDDTTKAYVGKNTIIDVGNNLRVLALDTTKVTAVAGSAGIGITKGGAGGSVDVLSITKDTESYIDDSASITALGVHHYVDDLDRYDPDYMTVGVRVQATSSENITDVIASGGGGLYAGVAGNVAINVDDSTTKAYIGNNNTISSNESIDVGANNTVKLLSVSGAAGGGKVGVSGAVDVGVINNETDSYIGNGSTVTGRAVNVSAISDKDIDSYVVSLSGGAVGIAGSVSVYAVDTDLSDEAKQELNAKQDANDANNPSQGNVQDYADSQMKLDRYAGLLGQYQNTDINNAGTTLSNNKTSIGSRLNDTTAAAGGTNAYIGSSKVTATLGSVNVNAKNILNFTSGVGAVSGGAQAYGVSVGVLTAKTNAAAYVAQGGSILEDSCILNSSVAITAQSVQNVNANIIGGGLAGGSGGVAGTLLVEDLSSLTQAYTLGPITAGALTITATHQSDLDGILVAPSVGGFAEGAAVATILDTPTTNAYVGPNIAPIKVRYYDMVVNASTTDDIDVSEAVAAGGGTAAGQSIIYVDNTGKTYAYIDTGSKADVAEDLLVTAVSHENVNTLGAAATTSDSAALSGTGNVNNINTDTQAYIGADTEASTTPWTMVTTGDSLLVQAQDDSELNQLTGGASHGGLAGVGASAGVNIVAKNVQAFLGSNVLATVLTGDTFNSTWPGYSINGVTANMGGFDISYNDYGSGDVVSPGINTHGYGSTDNQNLTKKRKAQEQTGSVLGIAVSASSQNTLRAAAAAGTAGAGTALAGAASVNVVTDTTKAHIGQNSKITTDHFTNSNLLVAAANDYDQLTVGGGLSGGGATGIGAGAGVSVVNNTTQAYFADGAQVTHRVDNGGYVAFGIADIAVKANAHENITALSAALGASGEIGVAGAVTATVLNDNTKAYIGGDTDITAIDGIEITATDTTDVWSAAGSAGFGIGIVFGASGIGGSVDVVDITKNTESYIADNAVVDAKVRGNTGNSKSWDVYTGDTDANGDWTTKQIQGLSVQANSKETITNVAAGGGAGFYGGVAGSVGVDIDHSTTKAYIGKAKINSRNAETAADTWWSHNYAQSVSVAAVNDADILSVSGSGAAAGLGVAGSVDVGLIKNNTAAYIADGANVIANALGGIDVTAMAGRNIESYTVGVSAGAVGLAGSVSVYGIDDNLTTDALASLKAKKDVTNGNNPSEDDVEDYVDHQLDLSRYQTLLSSYQNSDIQNAGSSLNNKSVKVGSIISGMPDQTATGISVPNGTVAMIGKNATVSAGKDIKVKAQKDLKFTGIVGSGVAGGTALGGAVSVISTADNVQAYIGTGSNITADNLSINSDLTEAFTDTVAAGGAGFTGAIAGAAGILDDSSSVSAYAGSGTMSVNTATVKAEAEHSATGKVVGASVALAGPAASGAVFTANVDGTTKAYGTLSAANCITIQADTDTTLTGTVIAPSAGFFAGGAAITTLQDKTDTEAYVDKVNVSNIAKTLTIAASHKGTIAGEATGVGVGGIGIGAAIANAEDDGKSEAFVSDNGSVAMGAGGTMNLVADNTDTVQAKTTAGAAGAGAGGGSKATATVKSETKAYTGSNVQLNLPSKTTIYYNANGTVYEIDNKFSQLTVKATATPAAKAVANGYNFGALSVGVSLANAEVDPTVQAFIGSGNITGAYSTDNSPLHTLNVTANLLLPSDGISSYAEANGSGGGLIDVNATSSTAKENYNVAAYLGDNNSFAVAGSVNVAADADSKESASASGKVGGIIAAGANLAETDVTPNVAAYLGTNITVTGGTTDGENIIVSANGNDDSSAEATAGSGGIISGAAAKATTNINKLTDDKGNTLNNVWAGIGKAKDNTKVNSASLAMTAEYTGTVHSHANSLNASVAGASGAIGSNTLTTNVKALLNSNITTKELEVKAVNHLLKPARANEADNVEAGSGGLLNGAAAQSDGLFTGNTEIVIGEGANLALIGDKQKPGDMIFEALTDMQDYDGASLKAGGAIEIAKAVSTITMNPTTKVSVEKNVKIDSVGDITLAAYTTDDARTFAGVNVWGLAGASQGATASVINPVTAISLAGSDSPNGEAVRTWRTDGDINLYAGRSASGLTNMITARANTDLYNDSVIPIEGAPKADASVNQTETVDIGSNNWLGSVNDINLLTEPGTVTSVGYGKGEDAYREALAKLASAISNLFGGGDVSFATEYNSGAAVTARTVNVNGKLETGIQNKQVLIIDPIKEGDITAFNIDENTGNGNLAYNVTIQNSEGVSYSITKENLVGNLFARRQELENLKANYAGDDKAIAAYDSDIAYIDSQLASMGMLTTDSSGNKVALASADVYYLNVNNITAKSGNINVTADNLTGSGILQSPKDSSITIINNSPLYVRTHQLTIDDKGGHVNFNGVEVTSTADVLSRNKSTTADAKNLQISLPRGGGDVKVSKVVDAVTYKSTNGIETYNVFAGTPVNTIYHLDGSSEPTINVSNAFDPILYNGDKLDKIFTSAPDIQITDSIINASGLVSIYNKEGSISLQGGSDGGQPNIVADTVKITATNGNVYQAYTTGLTSVGGDPRSLWNDAVNNDPYWRLTYGELGGLESTVNQVPKITTSGFDKHLTANGSGGIFANGTVYISGEYLNINGTIQSGVDNWSLTLDNNSKYSGTESKTLGQFINDKKQEWVAAGSPSDTKYQITGLQNDAFGTIAAYYNPATNQIELGDAKTKGGRVELFGQIMNTGGGNIKAMDGYSNISITNNTSYGLVLNALDTGDLHGVVKITDTGKVYTDAGNNHYYQVTQYERNDDGKIATTVSYTGTSGKAPVTTVSGSYTRTVDGGYSPVTGTRYVWTLGQDKSVTTVDIYDHKKGIWGWDPLGWVTSDSDKVSSTTTTGQLVALPNGAYAVVDTSLENVGLERTYNNIVLNSNVTEYKASYSSGFAGFYKHYVTERITQTGSKDVYTYSAKADYPIGISFIGNDAGNAVINVKGCGNIVLNKSLTNQGGKITVSASNGSITSNDNSAVISAQSIALNAGGLGNAIGNDLPINVKLLGSSGSLTAGTQAGNINLKDTAGDLLINNIDTYYNGQYGTVALTADGSILQALSGSNAVICAGSIDLRSTAGTIGSAAQALNVSVMGTGVNDSIDATAAKDINLRQPNGDFRLGHIESKSGDVTVEAANGSLVDANPLATTDTRTVDELNALWDRMQVKQGDQAAALNNQTLDAYAGSKTSAYFDYWRMRHVTTAYDSNGKVTGYTADAYDPNYTYTATDSDKLMFAQNNMTAAQQQQYINQKTEAYRTMGSQLGSDATYDANYTYTLTDGDRAGMTTKGWTDSQLKYSIDLGIAKQTASTDSTLQDPNVTGRHVKLIAKQGGIGTDNGELVIKAGDTAALKDITNADGTVTPSAARLALSAAESDDVTIDSDNNIHIALRKAVYTKSYTLEAAARDNVYIGSATPIYVESIQSGTRVNDVNGTYNGTIRLKGKAGIYDVSTPDKAALQGISAGDYLAAEKTAYVEAQSAYNAAQSTYNTVKSNEEKSETQYSQAQTAYDAANADYIAASDAYQAAKAKWDQLNAFQKLVASNMIAWQEAQTAWQAAQTNLASAKNNLTKAESDYQTAQNNLTIAQAVWNEAQASWYTAQANWTETQKLAALKGGRTVIEGGYSGSIGIQDAPFSVSLADGAALTARAAGNIYIDSLYNDLTLAEVYSQGDVRLHAHGSILTNPDASINSVATQGNIVTFIADTGTLGTDSNPLLVDADNLIVNADTVVIKGQVNDNIALLSNNITLRDLYSIGSGPLTIMLKGYQQTFANKADITLTGGKDVVFDSMNAVNAAITAGSTNNLSFYNTIIGNTGIFTNKYYTAVAGTSLAPSQLEDAALALKSEQNKAFYLKMLGNRAETDAPVLRAAGKIHLSGEQDNDAPTLMGHVMNVDGKIINPEFLKILNTIWPIAGLSGGVRENQDNVSGGADALQLDLSAEGSHSSND